MLDERAEAGDPLRVGLIGAGKFGTMYLVQAFRVSGLHVLGVADLSVERARKALDTAGWTSEQIATDFETARKAGSTCATDDVEALIRADGLDVVVDATGDPAAGIRNALACIENGRHIVMVNVEADVLAGPLLARKARAAGVVYSLAYGDQPALICELVEWARINGFEVMCAGKGTKYLPAYYASTPEAVWDHYGFSAEVVEKGGLNPKMFNSFLDGTKSAIEMAAVANATGLVPPKAGLGFPPCGINELPEVCKPRDQGGSLERQGTVEVVSSLRRDGSAVERDLRWGVYVTFEAGSDYVAGCFTQYGLTTDSSGSVTAMYRPYHLVGMELNVSVLRAGLRGEATGAPEHHLADVVATAKRDLEEGEMLDGEGGTCVYGVIRPAATVIEEEMLPVGLSHDLRLKHEVAEGKHVRWADVEYDPSDPAIKFRREMEKEVERQASGA